MRGSGILMPIFSLSSPYGIGTLGKKAFEFIDFLKRGGQSYWQILPLCPIDYSGSPYQSVSCFAGNPLFIDLDLLAADGLLAPSDILEFSYNNTFADYNSLKNSREVLFSRAFKKFDTENADFKDFKNNSSWLRVYSAFCAIKDSFDGLPFTSWDEKFRRFSEEALVLAETEFKERTEYYNFIQYEFFKQWSVLKAYANENGIKIIGDIPIYVALDSADVWSDPTQFDLNSDFEPNFVAGVSPDAFSATGQRWGNPLYNWQKAAGEKEPFSWWKKRLSHAFKLYDTVRIDHFRAFESYYAIPSSSESALEGSWRKGPGIKFFNEMKKTFGEELPLIAEDLGLIGEDVIRLLKESGLPGMKVMQFGIDDGPKSTHLPHNYVKNSVAYLGTHDNDTIIGWQSKASEEKKKFAYDYIGFGKSEGFNISMIRALFASVSDIAVITLADLMGLDSSGRINTPGTDKNNWQWRIQDGCVNNWLADILFDLTATYARENTKK